MKLGSQVGCCMLAAQTMLCPMLPAVSAPTPTVARQAVEEVWDLLSTYYLDETAVNDAQFQAARYSFGEQAAKTPARFEALKQATLASLKADKYTRLVDQRGLESIFRYDVLGLGLILEPVESGFKVMSPPLRGSSAAGLIDVDDVVEELDGIRTRGKTSFEFLELVEAKPEVVVKVKNKDPITLKRQVVPAADPIAETRVSPDGVGYVKLKEFSAKTADRFVDVLREFDASNVRRVVVDLRGNPGGSFQSGVASASLLLPEGSPTVRVVERSGEQTYYVKGGGRFRDKVAIWVDPRSASSAEIFTGALRDNCVAYVEGDAPSFGKGLIQAVYGLKSKTGGGLVVTVAQYLRPSGGAIQGAGVTPDLPLPSPIPKVIRESLPGVEPSLPSAAQFDRDFDRALTTCTPPPSERASIL